MRKLMYVSIGFAVSCGLFSCFLPGKIQLVLLFAAVFLVTIGFLLGRKHMHLLRPALICLGCVLGLVWCFLFRGQYLVAAISLDGKTEPVTLRTVDYSYDTAYGIGVDTLLTLEGKSYQVRAYLNGTEPLEPGSDIIGSFRFRLTTPGAEQGSTYHRGQGIFLLAYQEDAVTIGPSAQPNWRDSVSRLRHRIQEILHICFPSDTHPFAQALLLGDTTELDYATDSDFKVSGIRHVVAVSGLHVSILFALVSTITLHKRWLTALVGFPTLFLFAALAGFTPSITRACIMSALLLLALLARREYDGATALSFAVLVMLFANPLVITSVSFQLSVASVAGIYLFDPHIRTWLQSFFPKSGRKTLRGILQHWFAASVSISVSAQILTTPLCAYYFGTVSLVGIVTNLLALWVVSLIFYGILGVCLFSQFWMPFATLLAKLISWPIRYVLLVAKIMADSPLAAVYTRSVYIVIWLIFVYVLLITFLLMRNRKPAVLICCGVIGLCTALLASWSEPLAWDTSLTVLDVGQGQCLLLRDHGKTYMVDCGGDSDAEAADIAAETILSRGVARLDGIIVTHLDRDHAGGLKNLLSRVDTELLILPKQHTDLGQFTDGTVLYADKDLILETETGKIRISAPTFPGSGNEMSLCVLFDTEKCDILITGDRNAFGERILLRNMQLISVDVLLAGHHGSKNSTCEELLSALTPETVCISVGENNPYGHPAEETLQRLSDFGCSVYRTDQHGTITIRR